jgi:hypothetical protein
MSTIIPTGAEARDLTPEERQQRSEVCFALEEAIKEAIARGREALWDLAANFYHFNENSGWSALGHEDCSEWLAQPEINITKSQYYRLIRRHKEMVLGRNVPMEQLVQLEPSKLDMVLPSVELGKITWEEARDDLTSLGARDLKEKYVGATTHDKQGDGEQQGGANTIDGTAADLDPDAKPIPAADLNGDADSEEAKRRETLAYASQRIDSWIDVGGDRRLAQRQLPKLLENHPVLVALARVRACIEKAPDAPQREDIAEDWELLVSTLGLPTAN